MTDQPKPETNATLTNLRLLAGTLMTGVPLQTRSVSEAILLCADTWEADRKQLADMREALAKALIELSRADMEGVADDLGAPFFDDWKGIRILAGVERKAAGG